MTNSKIEFFKGTVQPKSEIMTRLLKIKHRPGCEQFNVGLMQLNVSSTKKVVLVFFQKEKEKSSSMKLITTRSVDYLE